MKKLQIYKYGKSILVCFQQWGNIVIGAAKRIPHMYWSPFRGGDKQSIHSLLLSLQLEERNCSHGFPCCLPHCHVSLFTPPSPIWSVPLCLPLPPGMNIGRYDRLSLTWCSQLRWPNTLNMSTNLLTASTSPWLLWRRMGWGQKWNHAVTILKVVPV